MTAPTSLTPEPPKGPGVSLYDLVSGLTAKALDEGKAEIRRAEGNSGRIRVHLDLQVNRGQVPWHTAAVSFERRHNHEG